MKPAYEIFDESMPCIGDGLDEIAHVVPLCVTLGVAGFKVRIRQQDRELFSILEIVKSQIDLLLKT